MFTKAEYARYLQMISEKEQAMVIALEQLIPTVSDVALSFTLEGILREELVHNRLVGELIDRVMISPSEARMHSRTHIMGEARLTADAGGEKISGQTIGFSLGGLCVDLPVQIHIRDCFYVVAHFYDPANTIDRNARVSWCRQIGPNQYRAGLTFEES